VQSCQKTWWAKCRCPRCVWVMFAFCHTTQISHTPRWAVTAPFSMTIGHLFSTFYGLWLMQRKIQKKNYHKMEKNWGENLPNLRHSNSCMCNTRTDGKIRKEKRIPLGSLWFTTADSIIDSATNLAKSLWLEFMHCIFGDITFTLEQGKRKVLHSFLYFLLFVFSFRLANWSVTFAN